MTALDRLRTLLDEPDRMSAMQRLLPVTAGPYSHGVCDISDIQVPAVSRAGWRLSRCCGPSQCTTSLEASERLLSWSVNWSSRPMSDIRVARIDAENQSLACHCVLLMRSARVEFAPWKAVLDERELVGCEFYDEQCQPLYSSNRLVLTTPKAPVAHHAAPEE